jgi:NAD(P)-dependent dehydrogenase (short-subunit alcohol dehydrogenase family)
MHIPYTQSKQGHELQFAVNHLGHFHLTQLLVPHMASPGEITPEIHLEGISCCLTAAQYGTLPAVPSRCIYEKLDVLGQIEFH